MKWRISEAKGSGTDYIGDAEGESIDEAVRELWRKYIEDAAQKNEPIAWDHLRVEIWLDSGRVILFPAPSPYHHRVEKASCQITCRDLLASYNEMADSDMGDEKFDAWANEAMEHAAGLVSQAAKGAKLPEKLGRRAVKILYYNYGGDSGKPIREDNLSI